jgi:uncharacterized oligopeptide transporter (OPT) family protein
VKRGWRMPRDFWYMVMFSAGLLIGSTLTSVVYIVVESETK